MKQEIKIGNKTVGENHPCFIIAEGCDQHFGSMILAKKMVDIAIISGADAIKFQHHLPDEEMIRDVPKSSNFETDSLYAFLEKNILTLDQHKELKNYCDEKGIIYLCTPFSKKAADEIADLVPAFKIGSGENTDIPTLIEIAKRGKPLIISTGMTSFEEIDETLAAIKDINDQIILLHCVSEYPPKYEDINVCLISEMKNRFKTIIGQSDHTPDNYTCYAAVALGAKLIEKHIILDKTMPGPDQKVSIDPKGLYELVDGIRKIEKSLGSEKKIHELEKPIRKWAKRSVVSIKEIREGETLTLENLWSKRPGTGIPSKDLFSIIGKRASRNIAKNKLLNRRDFE